LAEYAYALELTNPNADSEEKPTKIGDSTGEINVISMKV